MRIVSGWCRRAWLVSAIAGALTWWPWQPASDAAQWRPQILSLPPVANGELAAVSCTAGGTCTAVGSFTADLSLSEIRGLVEHWDGRRWSIQQIPQPQNIPDPGGYPIRSQLTTISCASRTMCMAIGSTSTSNAPLTERWNGKSWSRETFPDVGDGDYVTGLACPSPSDCVAVGYRDFAISDGSDNTYLFAASWNGVRWSMRPVSSPRRPLTSYFTSLSCPSARHCIAIGSLSDLSAPPIPSTADVRGVIIGRWDGSRWSIQRVHAARVNFTGLSCSSQTECVGVGGWNAARWSGGTWSFHRLPRPSDAKGGGLRSVSCVSSARCSAVGSFRDRAGTSVAVIENWNGARWSTERAPSTSGAGDSALQAISCVTHNGCSAVGRKQATHGPGVTLIEHRGGHRWSVQPSPNAPGLRDFGLSAVSCSSLLVCTALGSIGTFGRESVTATLSGSRWTVTSSPSLGTGPFSSLSCASAVSCIAVGERDGQATAAVWTAGHWSTNDAPRPSGAQSSELSSVSCPSPTGCMAVGSYEDHARNEMTLAETWNGARWTIESSPDPLSQHPGTPALSDRLAGVSCSSVTSCVAVGNTARETFAMTWDGTSWTLQPVPTPPDVSDIALYHVSCSSASACTAAGYEDPSSELERRRPLAERWDGSHWTIQNILNPGGQLFPSVLDAVSCASQTWCVALRTEPGDLSRPLAFSWDGTSWSPQATSLPDGSVRGDLFSLSCTTPATCIAVGGVTTHRQLTGLVERY
jgi:hypothetical protein